MGKRAVRIHPEDSVGVALEPLGKGDRIMDVVLKEAIETGHKFALFPILKGEKVFKYGFSIGIACHDIQQGEKIHANNLRTQLKETEEYSAPQSFGARKNPDTVMGMDSLSIKAYRRDSGEIAIRNELWVIPTVGCMNAIGQTLVDRFRQTQGMRDIDDIHFFHHVLGCSQLGEDLENTRNIIARMVSHPHAGGVLVLGLGCENNQISELKKAIGTYDPQRVRFLTGQDEEDEVATGMRHLTVLSQKMRNDYREPVPFHELKIGLKCGGSDGLSGITANPLLGRFSDCLVACGGATVLTEVPEMFGAEHLLMARAKNIGVFRKIVDLITDFKDYYIRHDMPVYENPSPGNKAGGITTLEEKSLGCTQKSGSSTVTDVIAYGERIRKKGLSLLGAPGNDMVSATALGASGCHMVLFTTGRGTPFGTFIPTVKIASNSALASHKKNWIDFDAGVTLEAGTIMEQTLSGLIQLLVSIANGEKAANERNGFKEIAIFRKGVTL